MINASIHSYLLSCQLDGVKVGSLLGLLFGKLSNHLKDVRRGENARGWNLGSDGWNAVMKRVVMIVEIGEMIVVLVVWKEIRLGFVFLILKLVAKLSRRGCLLDYAA